MGFNIVDPTLNSGVNPFLQNVNAALGGAWRLGRVLQQLGTMGSTIDATNAQNQALEKTAVPLALGNITHQDLMNRQAEIRDKFLPQQYQSQIGLGNAQANNLRFNMEHPYLRTDPYFSYLLSHSSNAQPSTTQPPANNVTQQQAISNTASPTSITTPTLTAKGQPGAAVLGGSSINPMQYAKMRELQKILPKGNGLLGEWQTVQAYKKLYGPNAPQTKSAAQALQNDINYKQQRGGYYRASNMTPQGKLEYIAMAQGMGITPMEAAKYIAKGVSLKDLAKQQGVSLKNVTPIYPATTGAITQTQKRSAAVAEVNSITPFITNALAPYARSFAGYSPTQIADALSNDNPDKQARFLAARTLVPEMSAMRIRALSGQVGVEAMKEVAQQTYGRLKIFRSLVSPQVFTKAQQYVDAQITKAFGSANRAVLQPLNQQQNTPAASTAMVMMEYGSGGKRYLIPANKVDAAQQKGFKKVNES